MNANIDFLKGFEKKIKDIKQQQEFEIFSITEALKRPMFIIELNNEKIKKK